MQVTGAMAFFYDNEAAIQEARKLGARSALFVLEEMGVRTNGP